MFTDGEVSACSPNTRTRTFIAVRSIIAQSCNFPAPSFGLVMASPSPPFLQTSDLTEHGRVSPHPLHSSCPEPSFQSCLPGDSARLLFPPCDPGLASRITQPKGAPQKAPGVGRLVSAPAPQESPPRAHPHPHTQQRSIHWQGQWSSAPSDAMPPLVRNIFKDPFVILKWNS